MKKPSASLAVSTLALAVALTGTATASGLIDGHSIRDHSIPASKLQLHSVTAKQIKTHAITKSAIDPNALTIVNEINAPKGDKGDSIPGPSGAPGAPGTPGQPGTPGANSPHAWGIVHGDGSLGDSANLTVRHVSTGIYCLSTGGYNHTNAIAVAQPWGSQLATPGYVGVGSDCNGTDEFQVDVLSPSSTLIDSTFSVVIA